MTSVAFIGLGVMGAPMARRLLASSHDVRVFDVNKSVCATFEGLERCFVSSTASEAAQGVDVLITMLPESAHVESVLFDTDGAIESLQAGSLVMEMSTGAPDSTLSIASRLAESGVRMIDAPVGRTPADAEAGTLLVLVGGSDEDIETANPLLEAMGDEIVRAGELGNGIKLKLVNNYMTMVGMVMTAETLMFGRKLGLDRSTLVHVLQNTVAGKGQINTNFPKKVLAGDITADFPLRLGLKDLSLALDLARSVGAPMALGGASRELFSVARSWGRSEQDCTAMLHLLEDIAQCE